MHDDTPFPTAADLAPAIAAALEQLRAAEDADTLHTYRPHMSRSWVVWDPTAGHSGERIPLAVWVGRELAKASYTP